ncbi:MAG TPA: glycosyltransferase family 4 protein [Candidatus Hydrogenedentes bacterium]|nr:glycosyltransferase family 4 protein [Candidatus Hydrogenedentota bacterium]HIJ74780.1 glycosyltransferase family 4 protein [Candidatus Hydrogenedentota bacterium]
MSQRIVLVIDTHAATPNYDESLVAALRAEGADARLLTADFYPEPYAPASRVPGRCYFFLRLSRALRRRFRSNRHLTKLIIAAQVPEYIADLLFLLVYSAVKRPLLHFQWLFLVPIDVVFLFFVRALGLSVVYTVHNPLPHDRETGWNKLLYGAVYRLANHLVFHSQSNLDDFAGHFPTITGKASVVPLGVAFPDRPPVDRQEARRRLGWEDNETVIVFQGQAKPYKGLDILLRAMAGVDTDKNLRLAISASWRFVDDRGTYRALLDAVAAKHRVENHDEVTPDDRFIDLACACDLWACPYRTATTSFTAMAAMRYGTPVVATATGSFPEMLGEELAEWIVPPDNVEALRDAITRFVEKSPEERAAIGKALFERAHRKYSWSTIAQKTVRIYDRLNA